MRQILLYIILLLVGAGAGLGGWMLVTNPKMQTAQTEIEDLKTQLQEAQDKAAADSKTAEEALAKIKLDLARSRGDMTRATTEMRRMQTENTLLKKALERVKNPEAEDQTAQAEDAAAPGATDPIVIPAKPIARDQVTTTITVPAGARNYIVQEGDSLWKIAAKELGNGARYKEIIALNPPMTEKSKLDIGKTIKIPAK